MAQLDASAFPVQARPASERFPLRRVDLALVGAAVALAVYGVLMVYSATHRGQAIHSVGPTYFVTRQGFFVVVGLLAMCAVALFDYRRLRIAAGFIYAFFIFLLMAVQVVGQRALGAQRAFSLAGFHDAALAQGAVPLSALENLLATPAKPL